MPARPELGKRYRGVWKIEINRQTIAKKQRKSYGDRRIAEKVSVDLIAIEENEQPPVLRLERLVERKIHIGCHLVEVVRDVEFEKRTPSKSISRPRRTESPQNI